MLASAEGPPATVQAREMGDVSIPHIQAQLDFRIKPGFVPWKSEASQYQGMIRASNPTGLAIRRALKRIGKTQAWLAETCGVSNNAVSLWVKTGEISREKAAQAAQALGLPVGALVGDENPLSSMLGEAIMSLPEEECRSTIDFLLYNLERTEALFDGEKLRRYVEMIQRFKADLAMRKATSDH